MKAYVLHDVGDLRLEDVKMPEIAEGQVLVKVKAAGICGSDIPRAYETGAHVKPLIIGHEFSGQVVKAHEGSLWADKRVGIFPLIPCGKCIPCQKNKYEMCRNYSYLGSRTDGGFAEYVAVPEKNLIELPDNVSYEAAAMLEPMAVAVHSIRRGMSVLDYSGTVDEKTALDDKTIVVCGLGTIGLLLTMFLMEIGFKNILVVGNKDFQKENALKLGITEEQYCDIRCENVLSWIDKKTNGVGADLFFECVGKNETVNWALEAVTPAGGVVLVGNPYSDMKLDKALYWKILRNQLKVTGTWNSSFTHDADDDWHYVIDCLAKEKINPEMLISHRLDMDNLENGFLIMRDKLEDFVKVMGVF